MTIDEPVDIVEYDMHWPAAFVAERQRLCKALVVAESNVEHIGSTVVPGLEAKPIIDLMLGVIMYPPPIAITSQSEHLGYENLGEAGVHKRMYFRRRAEKACNLHVVLRGGKHWIANRALRDYLCAHPAVRMRYGQAKRQALASGHATLLSYSEAKARIVNDIVIQALAWSRAN